MEEAQERPLPASGGAGATGGAGSPRTRFFFAKVPSYISEGTKTGLQAPRADPQSVTFQLLVLGPVFFVNGAEVGGVRERALGPGASNPRPLAHRGARRLAAGGGVAVAAQGAGREAGRGSSELGTALVACRLSLVPPYASECQPFIYKQTKNARPLEGTSAGR
jgi:hypothetical protein